MSEHHVCTKLDKVVNLALYVSASVDTLVLGVDNDTVVTQETYRGIVLGLLVTT